MSDPVPSVEEVEDLCRNGTHEEQTKALRTLRAALTEAEARHCGWKQGDGPCRLGRDNLCEFCEVHMEHNVLQAKLTEAQRDKERLDWLNFRDADLERYHGLYAIHYNGTVFGDTLREAIDAAMEGEK